MADLYKALRNAHNAGDENAARRIAAMIKSQGEKQEQPQQQVSQDQPDAQGNYEIPNEPMTQEEVEARQRRIDERENRSVLDKAIGVGEAGLSALTGATSGTIAGIPSGIAGAIGDLADILSPEEAQQLQQRWMDRFTYSPRTEAGQEYTKEVGDVFGTLPPAGLGKPVISSLDPIAVRASANIPNFANKVINERFPANRERIKSMYAVDDIERSLVKGDESKLAETVNIDPEIEAAAQRLGMKEEGITSLKSQSPEFIGVEQTQKSVPNSPLQIKEDKYVSEIKSKADDLINKLGSTDKVHMSEKIKSDITGSIKDLEVKAESIYDDLGKKIDPRTQVDVNSTREYIGDIYKNVNGNEKFLSPLEKRLLDIASDENVTYTAIDRLRKQVGASLRKESDMFKSETRSNLSKAYKVLTEDQEGAAPEFSDDWAKAKSVVQKRKQLEDDAMIALGKELSDSYIPKLGSAMRQLDRADTKRFNQLISAIPKKNRPEAVATALGDVMKGASKNNSLNPEAFATWYDSITKNGVKRNLYKYLPADFTKQLDDIYQISKGIRRARAREIRTGKLATNPNIMTKALNMSINGLLGRLPGIVGEGIKLAADSYAKRPEAEALKLLSDPNFITGVKAIVENNQQKLKRAENRMRATKAGAELLKDTSLASFIASYNDQPDQQDQTESRE